MNATSAAATSNDIKVSSSFGQELVSLDEERGKGYTKAAVIQKLLLESCGEESRVGRRM